MLSVLRSLVCVRTLDEQGSVQTSVMFSSLICILANCDWSGVVINISTSVEEKESSAGHVMTWPSATQCLSVVVFTVNTSITSFTIMSVCYMAPN